MSLIDTAAPRPDHPWLAEFAAEPDRAFDRLIRGIAVPFTYGRGEPREMIALLFGALSDRDPLRGLLDDTVGRWLAVRRRDKPQYRVDHGVGRYIQEVSDALHLVYRLDLSRTGQALLEDYFVWASWTGALRLNDSRDAGREFLTVIAHVQSDWRFESLWLRLCDEAGERWEPERLTIGLIGLRRLPRMSGRDPLDAVLAGLARWAVHLRDGDESRFRRQWRALRALYPNGPGYWHEHVTPLLDRREEPFVGWWLAELPTPKGGPQKKSAAIQTPPRARREAIEARIGVEPIEQVRPDIERLIADQLRYAEATGISEYLVLTARNFGDKLVGVAPDLSRRFAHTAIRWASNDPRSWTLWAKSLVACGQDDLAELLLWETIRRFPDNDVSRAALAELLARTGRSAEAESLYRETIRRFPDNVVSRAALAELLARAGRSAEAEGLYRETIRRFPDNDVSITALACLLIERGDLDAAGELIAALQRLDAAAADRIQMGIARARRGEEPFPGRAEGGAHTQAVGVPMADPAAETVRDDGRVVRAGFRLGPALDAVIDLDARRALRDEARAELDEILSRRPDHVGAQLLTLRRDAAAEEDRAARWSMLAEAFPDEYGVRLEAAVACADAGAFAALLAAAPRRAAVTRLGRISVGCALDGDVPAVVRWVAEEREETVASDPAAAHVWRTLQKWAKDAPLAEILPKRGEALAELVADAAWAGLRETVPLVA